MMHPPLITAWAPPFDISAVFASPYLDASRLYAREVHGGSTAVIAMEHPNHFLLTQVSAMAEYSSFVSTRPSRLDQRQGYAVMIFEVPG